MGAVVGPGEAKRLNDAVHGQVYGIPGPNDRHPVRTYTVRSAPHRQGLVLEGKSTTWPRAEL